MISSTDFEPRRAGSSCGTVIYKSVVLVKLLNLSGPSSLHLSKTSSVSTCHRGILRELNELTYIYSADHTGSILRMDLSIFLPMVYFTQGFGEKMKY